jgi:hypothetical protein
MMIVGRQKNVLDHLDEVERGSVRKKGGGTLPSYFLHGFSCRDQISALLKKGAIRKNPHGESPIFLRVTPQKF